VAKSILANLNPRMLRWARETARLSVEDVAKAEKISPERLQAWELGEGSPTFARLEKLAGRYRRPMMVFYLPAPPTDFNVVRDYRTRTASERGLFSSDATTAIRRIQERQVWASSYLRDSGGDAVSIIGAYSLQSKPATVGTALRSMLGVSVADQARCPSNDDAFRMWRERCEACGILVFSFSGISVDEMRGFAISDEYAPVAAVNSQDNYGARIFSLLHECVHLALGDSGVSTRSREALAAHKIERFCESAAAEAIMPMADFRQNVPSGRLDLSAVVDALARRYRCSKTAVLYRLVDSKHLSLREAFENAAQFTPHVAKGKGGPIPQAKLVIGRNGRYFSRTAVSAYYAGIIHGGELSALLGMGLKHLPELESHLNPSQIHAKVAGQSS